MAEKGYPEILKKVFNGLDDMSATFLHYKQIRKPVDELSDTNETQVDEILTSVSDYLLNVEKALGSFKILFTEQANKWKSEKMKLKDSYEQTLLKCTTNNLTCETVNSSSVSNSKDPVTEEKMELKNGDVGHSKTEDVPEKKPFLKLVDIQKLMDPNRTTIANNDSDLSTSVIVLSDSELEGTPMQKSNSKFKNKQLRSNRCSKEKSETVLNSSICKDLDTEQKTNSLRKSYKKNTSKTHLENKNQQNLNQSKDIFSSESDEHNTEENNSTNRTLNKYDKKLHMKPWIPLPRISCEELLNRYVQSDRDRTMWYVCNMHSKIFKKILEFGIFFIV